MVNPTPRPLYPEEREPDVHCTEGWVGRTGRVRKFSHLPAIDLRTVQSIGSRCTDWSTAAHPFSGFHFATYGLLWIFQQLGYLFRHDFTLRLFALWSCCSLVLLFVTHLLFSALTIWRLTTPYSGRTAPLTSKRCILYIYSTNIATEYFKHGIYSPSFPLQNVVCSIILTYLVPVLFTFYIQDVLKLKKK